MQSHQPSVAISRSRAGNVIIPAFIAFYASLVFLPYLIAWIWAVESLVRYVLKAKRPIAFVFAANVASYFIGFATTFLVPAPTGWEMSPDGRLVTEPSWMPIAVWGYVWALVMSVVSEYVIYRLAAGDSVRTAAPCAVIGNICSYAGIGAFFLFFV